MPAVTMATVAAIDHNNLLTCGQRMFRHPSQDSAEAVDLLVPLARRRQQRNES